MEILKTFRHEFKYIIPIEESYKLRNKLDKLLTIDRNYSGYLVRSLYFDSIDNNDYYEKLDGVMNRKKIRMRIYENNPKKVKLEIKNKMDIHQLKESLIIPIEIAREIINGNYNILLTLNDDLANKIYSIMTLGHYMPKVIIEYDRVAYITTTTTRITLDYNIRNSYDFDLFLYGGINFKEKSDKKDCVLEVKFDRMLEPYISEILKNYINRYQSVSKYQISREF